MHSQIHLPNHLNHSFIHPLGRHLHLFFRIMSVCLQIQRLLKSLVFFVFFFNSLHPCNVLVLVSERCQKLTFDNQVIGFFCDVKELHYAEKEHVLKTSPLTEASVWPSKLQLQNVQHVLKVFRLQECNGSADFIQSVLDWWNVVNVSWKGQDIKLKDPQRGVQDLTSTNLATLHEKF